MELVSKDFDKFEEDIINRIENSDYISFDLEMTGIENEKNNSLIDTPENRYLKYKKTSEKYSIIQLGLSLFKQIKNPNNPNEILYECYPYNLYIFPNSKDLKELSQDNMNLEIKCMLFNRRGKIDFNKWINEGIHYLNEKQYRELYKKITENNINNDNFHLNINHLDQKTFDYELAQKTIEDIQLNFLRQGRMYANSYIIDCMPKFLLYYIKTKLPKNLYFQENFKMRRNWCTLITGYKTQEEKDELYKNDILNQLRELEHKKGAKKIFDAIFNKRIYGNINLDKENINNININKRKKILIGHNMSLDLLFIISKFGEKLPDEYISFKQFIKANLECIYDTKYLFEEYKNSEYNSNNCIIKEIKSVLNNMYPYLKSSFGEFVKIKIKTKEDIFKEDNYHSAGYD
jgi:poly(A)-specific ribonuclease